MARKVKVSPAAVKVLERMARSRGIQKHVPDSGARVPGTGTCLEAHFHHGKADRGIHDRLADTMFKAGLIEYGATVRAVRRVLVGHTGGDLWTVRRKYANKEVAVRTVCPTAKGWNVLNDRKARKG